MGRNRRKFGGMKKKIRRRIKKQYARKKRKKYI